MRQPVLPGALDPLRLRCSLNVDNEVRTQQLTALMSQRLFEALDLIENHYEDRRFRQFEDAESVFQTGRFTYGEQA